MSLTDWFRPPRSLLTLYVAGAAAALLSLTWLAVRQLGQDELADAKRRENRLEAVADRVVALSQQYLNDATRVLSAEPAAVPPDTVVVDGSDDSVRILAGGPLPFLPVALTSTPVPLEVFEAGESAEFEPGGLARAEATYRVLASNKSASIRAGALMRLARVLRKANRPAEALRVYADLAQLNSVVIEGGRPADLVARLGRCGALERTGQASVLTREAEELRQDLARGRWPVHKDLWDAVLESATKWAGAAAAPIAGLEQRVVMATALQTFWTGKAPQPEQLLVSTETGSALVVSKAQPNGVRAAISGPDGLATLWAQIQFDTDFQVALTDRAKDTFLGRPLTGGTQRLSAEYRLPWSVTVANADPDRSVDESHARRLRFLVGLALVGVFIVVSGYFTLRGIRREIAIGQLQSEFVSAVSHEFRTPLTSIHQLSHMLQTGRVESDERRGQYYDVLVRESGRLHRLVERLLTLGRAEVGRYRFEATDVCELARTVVGEFRRHLAERRIEISTPDGPCVLRADRELLSLAVWNLLDNAAKYSPASQPVVVDVAPKHGQVAIAVRDLGNGIAPCDRERIFEKFVRGRDSDSSGTTGSGLGLALVDRVVRAHGGRVTLDTELGQGSAFTILIPMESHA